MITLTPISATVFSLHAFYDDEFEELYLSTSFFGRTSQSTLGRLIHMEFWVDENCFDYVRRPRGLQIQAETGYRFV